MTQELYNIFPNLTEQKIWKLLLTIKFRYKKHGAIGISRLEATRYGTSERQLQAFIKYLRDIDAIRKVKMATAINWFKCNVYSLSKWFSDWLKEVKEFVKKKFEYINPTNYVKSRFTYKETPSKITFKVHWDKYIIHKRGRFKGVIYDVVNNLIINPLLLKN